jgi:enoyl-CoA hydratase/carnithine racemase
MSVERDLDTGTSQLLCSVRHGVATLTLNRPEARNALSAELSPALGRIIAQCAEDESVRALLITGAGAAFCAGGDVKSMGDRRTPSAASPDERYRTMKQRHHLRWPRCPAPRRAPVLPLRLPAISESPPPLRLYGRVMRASV